MSDRPLSRRQAVAALAAMTTAPLFPFSVAPRRIGLALITVRPLLARDFERTLHDVAAIGYRAVDMYIHESHRPPRETRAMLDRAGLACTSARVATPALYRGWERSLDAANVLGARWITLANVPYEERLLLQDWRELADVFNRVGQVARGRGLGFAYHNHDFELQPVEGTVPLDFLVASTEPDLVRLQMDVYWMTKGGRDPAAEIVRLGARVASLHLKDMDRGPEGGITTVGQGTIDFARILAAAERAGVRDLYVEEDAPKEPLSAVRESYGHLAAMR